MKGIYVIKFSIYPGVYKIGKSKNIEERINGFKKSEIMLGNVELCYSKEFEDHTKAERDIHELLKEYRCKENKEFFREKLENIIQVIESLDPEKYKIIENKNTKNNIEISTNALEHIQQMVNNQNINEYLSNRIETLVLNDDRLLSLLEKEHNFTNNLSDNFKELLKCNLILANRVVELERKVANLEIRINDIDQCRDEELNCQFN